MHTTGVYIPGSTNYAATRGGTRLVALRHSGAPALMVETIHLQHLRPPA